MLDLVCWPSDGENVHLYYSHSSAQRSSSSPTADRYLWSSPLNHSSNRTAGHLGGGEHWFECCCKQSLSCDQSGERCELADERLRCLTGNEQEQFFRTTWPGVMFWNAVKCLLRSLEICLGPSRSVLCEECEGFGLSEMSQVLLFFFYPHFCLSTVTPRWPFHLGFSLPLIKTFSASIQSVRLHQAAAIEIIRAADLMSSHSTQCSCGSKGWHKLSHTHTHTHTERPKLIGPALISLGKYVMRGCFHGKELSAPSLAMYTATHEPWYWTTGLCVCVRRRNKEAGSSYSNQPLSFQRDFLIRKLITLHPNLFLFYF